MEKIDRTTTSRMEIDDENDDENDDTSLGFVSNFELDVKLKSVRNLCVENKINDNNAFEMDMTGNLKLWLERKNNSQWNGIKMFKEVGDFLEASEKLYKYRINNLSEKTDTLIESFRAEHNMQLLKEDNEWETTQILKPKRLRLMLTTSEKLNYSSAELRDYYSVNKTESNIKMGLKNMFTSYSRPSNYMLSMFSSSTLAEKLKKPNIKETENRNENMHYAICNMDDLKKKIKNRVICPEFNDFIAEHDKNIDSEELQLEGIEYRFDPNNHTFMDKLNSDNDNSTCDEIGSSVEDSTKKTGGLLECIDGVDRDYSFFNPILLANWKEPKSKISNNWKAQAIAKATKSSKSSKKNKTYDTDEPMAETTVVLKKKKKKECNSVNNFKGMWKTMSEIDTYLMNNTRGLEQINPHKWNLLPSTKSITVDPTIQLKFLEYYKVQPHWWSEKKETDNKSISTPQSSISVRMDKEHECQLEERAVQLPSQDILMGDEENGCKSHIEEDDELSDDLINETKFSILKLKEEIKAIIDQECVETNSESEWSSRLSFLTLLQKLRVLEREEFSIELVFVSLLHMVNEHGLKLFEEPGTLDKAKEVYIVKPIIIT